MYTKTPVAAIEEMGKIYKLQFFLGWIFAITCIISLWSAFSIILRPIHGQFSFLPLRNLLAPSIFVAFAAVFAVAWWTIGKSKPSARAWGIAASVIYLLVSLRPIIFLSRPMFADFAVFSLGVAGLFAFSRRFGQHSVPLHP